MQGEEDLSEVHVTIKQEDILGRVKRKEDLSEFKIFINKLKRSYTRDSIVRKIKGHHKSKEDFLRVHKLPLAVKRVNSSKINPATKCPTRNNSRIYSSQKSPGRLGCSVILKRNALRVVQSNNSQCGKNTTSCLELCDPIISQTVASTRLPSSLNSYKEVHSPKSLHSQFNINIVESTCLFQSQTDKENSKEAHFRSYALSQRKPSYFRKLTKETQPASQFVLNLPTQRGRELNKVYRSNSALSIASGVSVSTRPSNYSQRPVDVAKSLCEQVERMYAEQKKQTENIMIGKKKETKEINSTLNVMKVLLRRAQKKIDKDEIKLPYGEKEKFQILKEYNQIENSFFLFKDQRTNKFRRLQGIKSQNIFRLR